MAPRLKSFRLANVNYYSSFSFVFRENRVPYYQRLFQNGDGVRQWKKTARSPYLLYPFYVSLYGSTIATMYAMGRIVLGHKTWF
ncbi:hypothetical protein TMEN_3804 [Trichophyton mentagrophytes]|nr:hypothetical protein TMEN_3804 [Trichophyton mentagrophytes]